MTDTKRLQEQDGAVVPVEAVDHARDDERLEVDTSELAQDPCLVMELRGLLAGDLRECDDPAVRPDAQQRPLAAPPAASARSREVDCPLSELARDQGPEPTTLVEEDPRRQPA